MIKSLDCPIVNPTLGGNIKVQDITSASLSPDKKRFIAGGPADQVSMRTRVYVLTYVCVCVLYALVHVWVPRYIAE